MRRNTNEKFKMYGQNRSDIDRYLPLILILYYVYVISLIGCRQMAPRPPQNGTATRRARNNII